MGGVTHKLKYMLKPLILSMWDKHHFSYSNTSQAPLDFACICNESSQYSEYIQSGQLSDTLAHSLAQVQCFFLNKGKMINQISDASSHKSTSNEIISNNLSKTWRETEIHDEFISKRMAELGQLVCCHVYFPKYMCNRNSCIFLEL